MLPAYADVGSKFASDFIPKAQAEVGLVYAGGSVELPVSLKGELSLKPWLKHKFLGEINIPAYGDFPGDFATVADVKRWFEVEVAGSQPLQADDSIAA